MASLPNKRSRARGHTEADKLILQAFAKLDGLALGVAVGTVFGLAILFATVFLILKGGTPLGPNLQLLSQFFFGYSVTFKGSLVGFAYGFGYGFILGWIVASLRNLFLEVYLHIVEFRANMLSYRDFMDP